MAISIRIGLMQLVFTIFYTDYPMRRGVFTHISKHLSFINIHPTTKIEIGIQLIL